MNDPRDFQALTAFGGLGAILLGLGLAGVLSRGEPIRRVISLAFAVFGVVLLADAGFTFHRRLPDPLLSAAALGFLFTAAYLRHRK